VALADLLMYNNALHEEVHRLHNQLHPYVPSGAAKEEAGVIVADGGEPDGGSTTLGYLLLDP
jgi:hypothetical protein